MCRRHFIASIDVLMVPAGAPLVGIYMIIVSPIQMDAMIAQLLRDRQFVRSDIVFGRVFRSVILVRQDTFYKMIVV